MARFLRLFPLLALIAPGCAGSVKFDEIDGFGLVMSSVWFHFDDGDNEWDSFTITNLSGACEKFDTFYQAQADFEKEAEKADARSWCDDMEGPYQDYVDAADGVMYENARYVDFSILDGDNTDPDEDTYDVDDGNDMALGGTVTYIDENFLAAAFDDYDNNGDLQDNCGMDPDFDPTDYYDAWNFDDGSVEFTGVDSENEAKGDLDVDLVTADEDEDDAGSMQAGFTASYCAIDL